MSNFAEYAPRRALDGISEEEASPRRRSAARRTNRSRAARPDAQRAGHARPRRSQRRSHRTRRAGQQDERVSAFRDTRCASRRCPRARLRGYRRRADGSGVAPEGPPAHRRARRDASRGADGAEPCAGGVRSASRLRNRRPGFTRDEQAQRTGARDGRASTRARRVAPRSRAGGRPRGPRGRAAAPCPSRAQTADALVPRSGRRSRRRGACAEVSSALAEVDPSPLGSRRLRVPADRA